MLRTYLKQARLSAGEGNRLLIVLPDELSASAAGTKEHKEEIQQVIADKTGKMVEVEFRTWKTAEGLRISMWILRA